MGTDRPTVEHEIHEQVMSAMTLMQSRIENISAAITALAKLSRDNPNGAVPGRFTGKNGTDAIFWRETTVKIISWISGAMLVIALSTVGVLWGNVSSNTVAAQDAVEKANKMSGIVISMQESAAKDQIGLLDKLNELKVGQDKVSDTLAALTAEQKRINQALVSHVQVADERNAIASDWLLRLEKGK